MVFIDTLFKLTDKIVVITGNAGYLCSEMAQGFHRAGCAVVILDADYESANEVANKIKEDTGNAIAKKKMSARRIPNRQLC